MEVGHQMRAAGAGCVGLTEQPGTHGRSGWNIPSGVWKEEASKVPELEV